MENIVHLKCHIIWHKNLIFGGNHATYYFLTHKVTSIKFSSLLKVALGKQGIYLLLSIGMTRNLSPKNSEFPLFFGILCQTSSV